MLRWDSPSSSVRCTPGRCAAARPVRRRARSGSRGSSSRTARTSSASSASWSSAAAGCSPAPSARSTASSSTSPRRTQPASACSATPSGRSPAPCRGGPIPVRRPLLGVRGRARPDDRRPRRRARRPRRARGAAPGPAARLPRRVGAAGRLGPRRAPPSRDRAARRRARRVARRARLAHGFEDLTAAEWRLLEALAARGDVHVSLPYEPGRAVYASLRRTVDDLARLAGGNVTELAPRSGSSCRPARPRRAGAVHRRAVAQPARLVAPVPRGRWGARHARARRRRGARSRPQRGSPGGDRDRVPVRRAPAARARGGLRHRSVSRWRSRAASRSARRRSGTRCSRSSGSAGSTASGRSSTPTCARRTRAPAPGRRLGRGTPARPRRHEGRPRGRRDDGAARESPAAAARPRGRRDKPARRRSARSRTRCSATRTGPRAPRWTSARGSTCRRTTPSAARSTSWRRSERRASRSAAPTSSRRSSGRPSAASAPARPDGSPCSTCCARATAASTRSSCSGSSRGCSRAAPGRSRSSTTRTRRTLDELRGARLVRPDAASRDRFLFATVCSRPRRRLVLVRQAVGDEGSPREPSPFWEGVRELFDPDDVRHHTVRRPLSALTRELEAAPTERERLRALATLVGRRRSEAAALARENGWGRRLERATGVRSPTRLTHERALRLVGGRDSYSVSELERMASCSAAWFVERYLRPATIDKEIDRMMRGSILHAALQRFYQQLPSAIPGADRVTEENLEPAIALMHDCVAHAVETGLRIDAGDLDRRELEQGLRRDLEQLVRDEAVSPSPFVPRARRGLVPGLRARPGRRRQRQDRPRRRRPDGRQGHRPRLQVGRRLVGRRDP